MFEEVKIFRTERTIAVETKAGRSIANLVELMPDAKGIADYARFAAQHGGGWISRTPATGVYNCAGMVWASRRTSVLDPRLWQQIIDDDGYEWLPKSVFPMPGDVAAYVDLDADELLHVGRVAYHVEGLSAEGRRVPMIISKWNSAAGESIHREYDVPFAKWGFNFEIRYLTDRRL
ncbi:MAG TPA: hypothetical protein VNH11_11030 [Pirellulales bacterium]|nr:hypothetical protein [Pirellulales bacterium]